RAETASDIGSDFRPRRRERTAADGLQRRPAPHQYLGRMCAREKPAGLSGGPGRRAGRPKTPGESDVKASLIGMTPASASPAKRDREHGFIVVAVRWILA